MVNWWLTISLKGKENMKVVYNSKTSQLTHKSQSNFEIVEPIVLWM